MQPNVVFAIQAVVMKATEVNSIFLERHCNWGERRDFPEVFFLYCYTHSRVI